MDSEGSSDEEPLSMNSIDENTSQLSDNIKSNKIDYLDSSSLGYGLKKLIFNDDDSSDGKSKGCCGCCCCNKKKNDELSGSSMSSDSDEGPIKSCLMWSVVGMNFTYKFILAISVSIVLITMICSFYTVIIINYVFFISTVVSYVLSPLFHGLSEDYVQYGFFSILQILLANPLIEFFIYFVIKTVKNFADSIFEFATLIKLSFVTAINSGYTKYGWAKEYANIADKNLIRQFGLVFASLLVLGVAGGIVYVTFAIDKFMITLGMIPYLAIVVQIICLMLPTYYYYGKIFSRSKRIKPGRLEKFIKKMIKKYKEIMEKNDENRAKQTEEEVQTYESAYAEVRFDALELSSESAFNSGDDKKKDDEEKKRGNKQETLLHQAAVNITPLFVAIEYVPLFEYTLQIGHDKFTQKRKRFLLVFFTFLNFVVIAYDIYRLVGTFSPYFLTSLILRIIFFPLICYFNIGTAFIYKAKSASLHFVVILSTLFTFVVFIASILVLFYMQFVSGISRIDNLDYIPNHNYSDINVFNDACFYNYEGVSLIDAYGLALGPYDVERNFTIFDNQMKYFFGPDWSRTIKYEVHHIDKNTPFIIYRINNNLTVYGFRGFSSGTELCLQIEMIAIEYVLPFCQDIVPFYRIFVDNLIGFYARFAHIFGNQFFDPVSMSSLFIDPVEEIIASKRYSDDEKILFTGINIGGMFSKVLGMIHKKQGIGFVTLPTFNDYFLNDFDFEDDDSIYITNVYNYNGWFTKQEPDLATNIGIPWISSSLPIERDSVYRTFCTISEMCGQGQKFYNYCSSVVDGVKEISDYFSEV